jgi:hypothetical protein
MSRRTILIRLCVGSLVISTSLAIAFIAALIYISLSGGFVLKSTPRIIQSVQPESVEQARQNISASIMRLPDSAKNVQYAFYAEWIAVLQLVRFEAPVQDCRAVAEEIVAKHNAEHADRPIPGLRRIDPTGRDSHLPTFPISTEPLSAPWFNPETIQSGLVAGQFGSHTPLVWIDTKRGVLYYYYSD